MNLPNLTPCPKLDCKAPIAHWHDGVVFACRFALRGEPCQHAADPCHAPRETAPLHLPDVDTVARAIYESDNGVHEWDNQDRCFKDAYRVNARAALDLIAANQPAWVPIDVDDIRPGMVLKRTDRDGGYTVFTVKHVERYGDKCLRVRGTNGFYVELNDDRFTWEVGPATVPAEPVDPRVEVLAEELEAEDPHCDDEWPCAGAERFRGVARRAIARLDEMGGESA